MHPFDVTFHEKSVRGRRKGERQKDRKNVETQTYSYQLLGSSDVTENSQDEGSVKEQYACLLVTLLKPLALHEPFSQVGHSVSRTLRGWVRNTEGDVELIFAFFAFIHSLYSLHIYL